MFAVEKLVTSKLHERSVNRRICTIDRHVGVVSVCVCGGVGGGGWGVRGGWVSVGEYVSHSRL